MIAKSRVIVVALSIGGLLAGCASSSKDIAAAYVSPLAYQNYDCAQMAAEMQRVSARASQLGGQLDDNATGDAVAAGVGAVLFWPALFFIKGDGPEATEYARLKGEYDALGQASIQKKCAIQPTVTASTTPAPAATEPAAGPTMAPAPQEQPAAQQQAAATPPASPATSRWHGEAARDACGKRYTAEIAIDSDRNVKGTLERDGVVYMVNGKADPNGKLDGSLASLSDPTEAAPKHLTVNLQFGEQYTNGGYSTFDGAKFDCTTAITLVPAAS